MARPREFDIDNALLRAMNVFWEHGYDGASLPILLEGMGLTRGSLYKAFHDKKSLFIKVLSRYETEAVVPAVAVLSEGSEDGLVRIQTLFESVVQAVDDGDQRGCLLCTAAAGAASVDAEIAEVVHSQLDQMQDGFEMALTASASYQNATREIRSDIASVLVSHYVGLRVLVRSNASTEKLERSVRAMSMLLTG